MIDLHNHTPLCHHASGEPGEYVERARELGLREFGFSEHSPWMFQYEGEQIAPSEEEFAEYLETMRSLREEVTARGDMAFRIGIEMDFIPGYEQQARAMAESFEFDYHIGSVHNLGDWIFDHPDHLAQWDERDVGKVYEEYFKTLRQMFEWDLIDIVGHLDLPKKFGHVPRAGYEMYVASLLPLLIESDAVVEINTAGRDKPIGEFYPSPTVVAHLARAGVPFTLGSDAHKPSEVGRYFDDALTLLRECGVKEIITFDKRRKVGIPI